MGVEDETKKMRIITIPTYDLISITTESGGCGEADKIVVKFMVEEGE